MAEEFWLVRLGLIFLLHGALTAALSETSSIGPLLLEVRFLGLDRFRELVGVQRVSVDPDVVLKA